MNSEITEHYLNNTYDILTRETQRILNDLKNSSDDKKNKHLHREIQLIHNIKINVLKLRGLKNSYDDKIKNI